MTRPRLGFLGVGWIGLDRMTAIARSGAAEIAAIADPSRERRDAALAVAPAAQPCEHLGQLLELGLDGLVIATPSALHAEQSIAALERRLAVFCQKPLGRTALETARVVAAARTSDRLLGVDLSYRYTAAVEQLRHTIRTGGIGRPYALDLVFHNAYGPEAAWFYDKRASGGGCVIDLGIHLVDLALWLLGFPTVERIDARLFAGGEPIAADSAFIEDYASVHLHLANNVVARLTCSWRISAGCDAVIHASVFGTAGGVALHNVNGSFYDFVAEHYQGTRMIRLADPPDSWGGRATVAWANQLAADRRFDARAEELVRLAEVVDAIYARGAT